MIYSIIAMIILVTFSAYFSATETAFTSLNKIRMKNMANDGNRRARQVLELSENYDNLLSTILVGNNLVNITLSSIATVLFIGLYPRYGATIATVSLPLRCSYLEKYRQRVWRKKAPKNSLCFRRLI